MTMAIFYCSLAVFFLTCSVSVELQEIRDFCLNLKLEAVPLCHIAL